ncbi:MAG: hypothetical protein HYR72_24640 [Deltaproteobacteria bacterium]|nr:hypothetical protein [Deltaproteobacteria bacterium]MBI3389291.1 hypothetical protein [Deltaproteobacteria bacterium]
MFVAYFDESGTHDAKSGVFTLACYVSSAARWEKFTADWNAALRAEGITEFHMADFENRVKQFAGWDDTKADRLIARLAQIINFRVALGISLSVFVEDYCNLMVPDDAPRNGTFGSPMFSVWRAVWNRFSSIATP